MLLLLVSILLRIVRVGIGLGDGELASQIDTSESRRIEREGSDGDEGSEENDDGSDGELNSRETRISVETRIELGKCCSLEFIQAQKLETRREGEKTNPATCSRD